MKNDMPGEIWVMPDHNKEPQEDLFATRKEYYQRMTRYVRADLATPPQFTEETDPERIEKLRAVLDKRAPWEPVEVTVGAFVQRMMGKPYLEKPSWAMLFTFLEDNGIKIIDGGV